MCQGPQHPPGTLPLSSLHCPQFPLGRGSYPHTVPHSPGLCPHTVLATPWHGRPVLSSLLTCSPQSLPWRCPLYPALSPLPTLRMSPLFPLPSQIPPQDLPLLPPWRVSGYVPTRPTGCPLFCLHSPLRNVTSLPSIPGLSVECPLCTLHCPKSSLWDIPSDPSTSPIPPWDIPLCPLLSPMTPPPTPHPGWGVPLSPSQTHIILEDCGDDNLCVPDLHLAADT